VLRESWRLSKGTFFFISYVLVWLGIGGKDVAVESSSREAELIFMFSSVFAVSQRGIH